MQTLLRILSLIPYSALAVSFALPVQAARLENDPDIWKSSGITMKDFILDEVPNCAQDAVHVLACIETLNALGKLLKHPVIFAHVDEVIQNLVSVGVLIKPISDRFLLYTLPSGATIRDSRLIRASRASLIDREFSDLKSVPFQKLFETLASQLEASALETSPARIAAYAYNVYLSVAVDPHTRIDAREKLDQDWSGESDAKVGVGLVLNQNAGVIRVAYDLPESPAEKAKIYRGDVLIELDGHLVKGATRTTIDSWIFGPSGSILKIAVMRGNQRLEFKLTREVLDAPSLSYSVVKKGTQPFGLIQIRNFMDLSLERQFTEALVDLQEHQNMKGLVIDLRGNAGGRIDAVLKIANNLLGPQNIVGLDANHDGVIEWSKRKAPAVLGNLPMVTLIDAQSASASEILAGALQDYGRAYLVGERTYGKGTAQLPDENYALVKRNAKIVMYRTYSSFYLPSGRSNQRLGIEPDFAVEAYPGEHASPKRVEPQREDDLYSDSPIRAEKWQQTRPSEVAQIEACRQLQSASESSALKRYHSPTPETTSAPDYRLWVAEDILSCVLLTQKLVE